ncbi:MAG TPA: proline racemase family protein [Terriglobales bacterium]|nr:proline racemase family protein [Terriglobales bacterium]
MNKSLSPLRFGNSLAAGVAIESDSVGVELHDKLIEKSNDSIRKIQIVDSHTGGEPTRLVIGGGPDLGAGSVADRLQILRTQHDYFRSAVVNEPRGSDVVVGALLCEPHVPTCSAGVIFFNNVGYLGMCGHGTIGLIASLAYLGRIDPGEHRIESPVGVVTAILHENGEVTVNNVPSYRKAAKVAVDVPGLGVVRGDVAWGGNWFFLVEEHGYDLTLKNIDALTNFTWDIRQALKAQGIAGDGGQEIDHIELFGPSSLPGVNSKNFVLCPGKAYDRSPCGTGTSAKMACLFADGKLREGQVWKQESIIGSVFEGRITARDGRVYPSITGSAFVNSEAELVLDPRDPFCNGIRG